ncbi:MAG: aminotransferase class III-fold pyridoxal phosphate-dependent enzyme [Gemmatimonadaceae bacterium]|nr:aminotransferase class III-fold pyridoxal phosphate-dependent enzyme [Gemmatimonadaceae bacterium]
MSEDERLPEEVPADDWRARADAIIAGGASTGSKRFSSLFGDAHPEMPTHYVRASGCRIWTADGRELIDCTMALGAVALGYAEAAVTMAVTQAAEQGNVAGLSHVLEVDVAERLSDVIPCAERVRFMKSGAEGVAAAVRIARAHTRRAHVVGSGYFGWLDWWTDGPGITAGAHHDFTAVPFDDITALESGAAEAGDDLAAIVIEPVIERLPSNAWIEAARAICDERGAVLVFDEMKTGFRLRTGGFQEYSGITPDLAVFGKAMANGFPLSAIVGRESVMRAAADCWISSTLAGESVALAAASAVLDWHEKAEVCEGLWAAGEEMMQGVQRAITASGIGGVTVRGIPPMWLLDFEDEDQRTRFGELALEAGVLFKRGAYNYASLAHEESDVGAIESAASDAFVSLREELADG